MNTQQWKWFKLGDEKLFVIKKGKRLIKADMIEGNIRYIGATDGNNGITQLISNDEHIHPANTITVSYNGSVAEAFYQDHEFWATDDVNVLYPQFPLNKYIAHFITTIIKKEKYRFNYGRKWDKELMKKSQIKLPVDAAGNPDWYYMEKFVKKIVSKLPTGARNVWENQYDIKPSVSRTIKLSDRNWDWWRYDEVFKICKGFYNKKPENHTGSSIPFIGAIDNNNGISEYYDIQDIEEASKTGDEKNVSLSEKIFEGNCITVSNNGSVGYAFYQKKPFTCTHDVNPLYLHPKWNKELNPYIALFLCSLIEKERYRWTYGRKWRPKRMPSSLIKLPVDSNGKPDWQFMEDFIKSLPYSANI